MEEIFDGAFEKADAINMDEAAITIMGKEKRHSL